jgi:hypothetical protein
LIADHCHHEEKVEAERPEEDEFGAFEAAARDGLLLGFHELIVFERREHQSLIECGDLWLGVFGHRKNSPAV